MVFSSLEFLFCFLPIFLVVYSLTPRRFKNICLLLFSLAFYAYGTWRYPLHFALLIISILVCYVVAIAMQRYPRCAGVFLFLGLLWQFGCLFVFKYSGFVIENANMLLSYLAPGTGRLPLPDPILPIGISFYSFQAASYLIDVYKRHVPAQVNLVDFGAYLVMFPQLIAGPIVRYADIRMQLEHRTQTMQTFFAGLLTFVFGLGLKVILANRIGGLWQAIVGIGFSSISTPLAWLGLAACSLQLYLDFWGYSQMAIGLGKMIGFDLPQNFCHPYRARSMTQFWRRWHMTLGAWFRQYVYIPLGGNRAGKWRTYRNLFVVWLLTGIWHGAGWNFLLWGVFLFALIAMEKTGPGAWLERTRVMGHVYMMLAIGVCWLLFSVTDLRQIGVYLQRLVGLGGENVFAGDFLKYTRQYGVFLIAGVLLCTPLPEKLYAYIRKYRALVAIGAVCIFAYSVYCLWRGMDDPFLYFNF